MERLTEIHWRNLDPWECCGQDDYCKRGCHEKGGCANGCIVPIIYTKLARYEDIVIEPEEVLKLKKDNEVLRDSNKNLCNEIDRISRHLHVKTGLDF